MQTFDSLALVDATGVVLAVTPAWRAFGDANGQCLPRHGVGDNYLAIADAGAHAMAEGAAEVAEGLRAVLAGERAEFSVEYPCHSPTAKHWYRALISPIESATMTGAVVLHIDVTDRRLATEALRQSEQRFRGMFVNAPIGLAIMSADGRFEDVNTAYAAMLGYPEQDLVGRNVTDVTHPDDRARNDQLREELVRGDRASYVFEKRYLRADGEVLWGRVGVSAVRDADGEVVSLVGIKQDITEQRRAEQALREHRELVDVASRMGRIGGWAVRLPSREVQLSDQVCLIVEQPLGSQPERDALFAFLGIEAREAIGAAFDACATHGTAFDMEVQLVTARGTKKWARVIGRAQQDASGTIHLVQGAVQDITEQKGLEQQFLRAQRLESVGTLAGGIAHDLNNVFTPLLMSTELLRMDETDPAKLETLSLIEVSARRGADMVRQVLTFARGAEGRRVRVALPELVHDIGKIVTETFPKSITLATIIPPTLPTLLGDPTQLHQVLLNLCVNARDAMPRGGRLTISVSETTLDEQYVAMNPEASLGGHVILAVEDTGTGIPTKVIDRIFDPFFTTKELGHGTGLGLSTSLAIVRGHGGFVRVYSEVGAGTRFRVYLPTTAVTGDAAGTDGPSPPHLPRGKGELVLVVDDEPSIREITRHTLEAFGYRVVLASDGAEGVAVFATRQSEIALVLTDMMMPVMDGATMIEVLVRMHPGVRIVAASGLHTNVPTRRISDGVVRYFLPKPYTAESLLTVLRQALDNS